MSEKEIHLTSSQEAEKWAVESQKTNYRNPAPELSDNISEAKRNSTATVDLFTKEKTEIRGKRKEEFQNDHNGHLSGPSQEKKKRMIRKWVSGRIVEVEGDTEDAGNSNKDDFTSCRWYNDGKKGVVNQYSQGAGAILANNSNKRRKQKWNKKAKRNLTKSQTLLVQTGETSQTDKNMDKEIGRKWVNGNFFEEGEQNTAPAYTRDCSNFQQRKSKKSKFGGNNNDGDGWSYCSSYQQSTRPPQDLEQLRQMEEMMRERKKVDMESDI